MDDVCAICLKGYREAFDQNSPSKKVPGATGSEIHQVADERFRTFPDCDHYFHPWCVRPWLEETDTCPIGRAKVPMEPGWHQRHRIFKLVAAGFIGFAVASHFIAAVVRLPQQLVWARDRLYFELPLQLGAAWLSLFSGFALGAEGAVCVAVAWNPDKEVEWRHDWKLIVGSWCALWGGIIATQMLLGLVVARTNKIPIRNLWVLGERAHLSQIVRHRVEMAVAASNVVGAVFGLMTYIDTWHRLDIQSGDTVRDRERTFWTIATAMAGLLAASHLFTIAIKEFAFLPRRQTWHAFGIAKLFKGHPTLHSRQLALVTGAIVALITFIPSYLLWRGSDPEE